jgi:hypothetical protein
VIGLKPSGARLNSRTPRLLFAFLRLDSRRFSGTSIFQPLPPPNDSTSENAPDANSGGNPMQSTIGNETAACATNSPQH